MVWRQSMELATECFQLVKRVPDDDRYLVSDMLRTAVKIPSNIAGAHESETRKVKLRHLDIARGKIGRLHALLEIARLRGYYDETAGERARILLNEIQGLLDTLIDTVRDRRWD
jgi:four helix bundle protein